MIPREIGIGMAPRTRYRGYYNFWEPSSGSASQRATRNLATYEQVPGVLAQGILNETFSIREGSVPVDEG